MKKDVKFAEVLSWYFLLILAFTLLISCPLSAQLTIGIKGTGQYFKNSNTQLTYVSETTESGVSLPGSNQRITTVTTEAYLMASPFIRYDYKIEDSPFYAAIELSLSDRSFEALKVDLSALYFPFSNSFRNDHPDIVSLGISFDYDAGYSKTLGICPVAAVNLPVDFDIDFMIGFEFSWDVFQRHTRGELKLSFPLNL